eukprot:scaffold21752_cov30-Prasinocladus_malaysianus.AAC.2
MTYTGPLLNHAARVKSHAAGGQVLVDRVSWEHYVDGCDSMVVSADCLGSHLFKGLKEPVEVYQIYFEV